MSTPQRQSEELPKLTSRERRFVDAYVGRARFNKAEAARIAGYAESRARQYGSEMYKEPHIRAHIDQILDDEGLTDREVLALVAEDARRSDESIQQAASQVHSEIVASSIASGLISSRTTARTNMMRARGMFTDNVNLSGGIDIRIEGVDTEKL